MVKDLLAKQNEASTYLHLLPQSTFSLLPKVLRGGVPLRGLPSGLLCSSCTSAVNFQVSLRYRTFSGNVLYRFLPAILPIHSKGGRSQSNLLLRSILLCATFSSSFPVYPISELLWARLVIPFFPRYLLFYVALYALFLLFVRFSRGEDLLF